MGEVDGKRIVTLIGNQSNTSDYHALYSKVINRTLLITLSLFQSNQSNTTDIPCSRF